MIPCLILGAGLDGAPAPLGLPPLTVAAGPLGFIDHLGLWLGQDTTAAPEAVRIAAAYRALADLRGRFFWSRSFEVDPWAASRRVLRLRDDLVMAGWDGTAGNGAPPRVADLAAIPQLPASIADILRALSSAPLPGNIPRIALLEPIDLWPPLWRTLLVRLAASQYPLPIHRATGDLAALQDWFTTGQVSKWQGDGSLVLLTSDGNAASANVVSSLLPLLPTDSALIGADTSTLALMLRARHLPRTTPLSGMPLGAQLLALALALHWEPFDAEVALEFLQLPNHPLGGSKRFLIEAIRTHPGHGGTKYRTALTKALHAKLRADKKLGLSRSARHKRARERMAAIATWLPEARHAPTVGLPIATIIEICQRVAQWAQRRQPSEEARAANRMQTAVQLSGLAHVPQLLLGRILESVLSDTTLLAPAEAAPWRGFPTPAARLDAVPMTVWWLAPGDAPSVSPWHTTERRWMNDYGLVPDEDLQPRRKRLALQQAIALAGERLILISPRVDGESAQPHPLLGLLAGCFGEALPSAWMEAHGLQAGGNLAGFTLPEETRRLLIPPSPQRDWSAPPGLLLPRDEESPSSLEKLLGCPLAWVLRYKAKLQARDPVTLPNIRQMTGTLLHEVMHQLFSDGYDSAADAARRAQDLFDRMVPEMAAPLLKCENAAERQRTSSRFAGAMLDLVRKLDAAALQLESGEAKYFRPLPGQAGQLYGRPDLLFNGPAGPLVLDAKWTSSGNSYEERLSNNTAVQLAAYAWLVGREAHAAYYLLRQRRLLAADTYPLMDAAVRAADLIGCWQGALEDYAAALKELQAGRVVAAGIEPSPANDRNLPISPPCKYCDYKTLCGAQA